MKSILWPTGQPLESLSPNRAGFDESLVSGQADNILRRSSGDVLTSSDRICCPRPPMHSERAETAFDIPTFILIFRHRRGHGKPFEGLAVLGTCVRVYPILTLLPFSQEPRRGDGARSSHFCRFLSSPVRSLAWLAKPTLHASQNPYLYFCWL